MAKNKQQDKINNNSVENNDTGMGILKVNLSEKYMSYLNKMDQSDQKQITKALDKFKNDFRTLKMKSLKNVCDSSTISLEINGKTVPLRIIGYLEKKGNDKSLNLFWVGTHPEYDKVVARGYVIKSKLESVPSVLYNGLTLSDLANETNEYKSFMKKEEVLDRVKNISGRHQDNQNKKNQYKN